MIIVEIVRIPSSTYRLQITPDFTLAQAGAHLDYLANLGVGAVYLSPILTSIPGSQHGYDWIDAYHVDPQRGGEDEWAAFVSKARETGLGIVVDIVPNHMGVARPELNHWWWDVLKHGPNSDYACFFDIDWSEGRIALPVLASGADIDIVAIDGDHLVYYDQHFPLRPGSWQPTDDPRDVHERQHYRLIGWRDEKAQLNYRRFFSITSLAGLRVEDERVAEATHERIRRFITEDQVEGLRIDHPDGLRNPTDYLHWLRGKALEQWIIAEKILEPGENLLSDWPVEGTTGYDALNEVLRVLINPAGEAGMTADWIARTGDARDAEEHCRDGKLFVAEKIFTPEVRRITENLDHGTHTPNQVADSLRAIASQMRVYRSYLPEGVENLHSAIQRAGKDRPDLASTIRHLTPQLCDPTHPAALRFQQLTGAVVAKGMEDTAFYRYNRFIALNEVGGDPGQFGCSVEDFHAAMSYRHHHHPHSMTTLSTHDTKRGEDFRARLAVLSELGDDYYSWVDTVEELVLFDCPPLMVLLAQTLLGTGKIARKRLHDYLVKAARESALVTSWEDPDEQFEQSLRASIDLIFDKAGDQWETMSKIIDYPGMTNAVTQKLVQLAMPGVPDIYQGTETFGISLVDPDNRRPVDYALLRDIVVAHPRENLSALKAHIVRTVVRLRRDYPELFTDYQPIHASGCAADHLLAFDRGGVIALTTRLPFGLAQAGGWSDEFIHLEGRFMDLLSDKTVEGPRISLAELFDTQPAALLATT